VHWWAVKKIEEKKRKSGSRIGADAPTLVLLPESFVSVAATAFWALRVCSSRLAFASCNSFDHMLYVG
jgi:hypothetical protein